MAKKNKGYTGILKVFIKRVNPTASSKMVASLAKDINDRLLKKGKYKVAKEKKDLTDKEKINRRINEYKKAFGKNFVRDVYGKKMESINGVYITPTGLISKKTELTNDSIAYLNQLFSKDTSQIFEMMKRSDDEYIKNTLDLTQNLSEAEQMLALGEQYSAKSHVTSKYSDLLQEFYALSEAIEAHNSGRKLPQPDTTDTSAKNLKLIEMLTKLNTMWSNILTDKNTISGKLDHPGRKLEYTEIRENSDDIGRLSDMYDKYILAEEKYVDVVTKYLASKDKMN